MVLLQRGILLCLLALSYSSAASLKVPIKSAESIPLPRQSHYLKQGLQGGMGLGNVWRSECQSRFQFQGGAEYSYNHHWSGGGAARLFGGAVDDETSLVFTRYFVHSRFHSQPIPTLDLYMGPFLGFDNTSIQSIRENWRDDGSDTLDSDSGTCVDAYDVNGPGLGWDIGGGWLFHPMMGFTASNTAEVNLQKNVRIAFSAGMAFNLYAVSSRMQESLRATWIHLDWVKAFTLRSGGSENSFLLGMSAGF